MEDRYIFVFISMWMDACKPMPFTIRNASKGVEGSIVVSIRDKDGECLSFIAEIIARTNAKVAVK